MSLKRILPLMIVLLLTGCSDDESTLDPALNDTPIVFTGLELSEFLVDTDTLDVKAGQDKSPDDPVTIPLRVFVQVQRPSAVAGDVRLRCTVRQDGARTPVAESSIDVVAEGQQRFDFDIELSRGDVGDYRVEVTGEDASGTVSARAFATLRVVYGSRPPELLELNAPDSVRLQAQAITFDMSVLVNDDSGPADIKQVFFNSFLPDRTPSTGNPFILRDQGVASQGDMVAGDGWYSIRVQVPPGAQKGEYEFQFRAVDFSNATSNVLIHKLIIY
ncbi:MAG: hypothetical protein RRA94_13380 [Bacteroidota bacterium]|nr:hypothetical protein [Bacteroidota bacterium]